MDLDEDFDDMLTSFEQEIMNEDTKNDTTPDEPSPAPKKLQVIVIFCANTETERSMLLFSLKLPF